MVNIIRNSNESKALNFVRFPLAVLVVFIHTACTTDKNDLGYYLGHLISGNIASVAVPTFFFISGYLFFAKYHTFGYHEYCIMVKRKCISLFIPYILFNLIEYFYIVMRQSGHFLGNLKPWEIHKIFWAMNDGYVTVSPFGYTFSIMCTPLLDVMWFIRDLMVVMLLSPIVWYIVKKLRMWAVALFILPWLFNVGIPIKGFGLVALSLFPLGATFSINGYNIFDLVKGYKAYLWLFVYSILLFAILGGVISDTFIIHDIIRKLHILVGILAVLSLSYIAIYGKQSRPTDCIIKLGETSFFIYACHRLFIFYPLRHLINEFETIPYIGTTIGYLLSAGLRIILCIAIYYVMKRHIPKLLGVFVGGR